MLVLTIPRLRASCAEYPIDTPHHVGIRARWTALPVEFIYHDPHGLGSRTGDLAGTHSHAVSRAAEHLRHTVVSGRRERTACCFGRRWQESRASLGGEFEIRFFSGSTSRPGTGWPGRSWDVGPDAGPHSVVAARARPQESSRFPRITVILLPLANG
jgi:hypothetical protein